jgi:hypothetical protein
MRQGVLDKVDAICPTSPEATSSKPPAPFMLGISGNPTGYRLWPGEITQLQEI